MLIRFGLESKMRMIERMILIYEMNRKQHQKTRNCITNDAEISSSTVD